METNIEKECSALGGLFQQVIIDMKNGTPLFEDFISKSAKLHTVLKSALVAIAAYLDAFQRIADSATNAKGATKDIGTVLTRICLRHKAVEARLKTFTSALIECLVLPLQDKLEEWKKNAIVLDKEHAKEFKKARSDVKKRSTEAARLQKKARKLRQGPTNSLVPVSSLSASSQEVIRAAEAAQLDLSSRLTFLHDTEKQALRSALVEERSRYCLFVSCLKPVVLEEVAMMAEFTHLEEVMTQLEKHTADPFSLPSASEQMISELKGADASTLTIQTPPSSPSSLGSRKSSMCSLGSLHSSSSGSMTSHSTSQMHSPSHPHPSHHLRFRSLSQQPGNAATIRLSSVSSQDSGFTSQDTLVIRQPSPPTQDASHVSREVASLNEHPSSGSSSSSSTPLSPYPPSGVGLLPTAMATWPNLQETLQFERAASAIVSERPHTISTAYEKGHQRPPLTVYTFQPLEGGSGGSKSEKGSTASLNKEVDKMSSQESIYGSVIGRRPPLPQRCSSLERPIVSRKDKKASRTDEPDTAKPIVPDFHQAAPDMIVPQPLYSNMNEIYGMVRNEGDDGSMIYGSIGSSSGYSSHAYLAEGEEGQACISQFCDEMRHVLYPLPLRGPRPPLPKRPASFSGFYENGSTGTLTRRNQSNSGGGNRPPPPPMRRSSVSSFTALAETADDLALIAEFVAEPMDQMGTTDAFDLANLPPPPDFLLESDPMDDYDKQANKEPLITERSLTVADAVRSLTQIRHMPASPGSIRRAQSLRISATEHLAIQAHQEAALQKHAPKKAQVPSPKLRRHSEHDHYAHPHAHDHGHASKSSHQQQQQHHAHINKKHMGTKTLPKLPSSQGHGHGSNKSPQLQLSPMLYATLPHSVSAATTPVPLLTEGGGSANPVQVHQALMQSLNAKLSVRQPASQESPNRNDTTLDRGAPDRQSFKEALNAKLAQNGLDLGTPGRVQRVGSGGASSDLATRVRSYVATKTVPDPSHCRDSLLDQIRRGTSLRRARTVNDRSAPHV